MVAAGGAVRASIGSGGSVSVRLSRCGGENAFLGGVVGGRTPPRSVRRETPAPDGSGRGLRPSPTSRARSPDPRAARALQFGVDLRLGGEIDAARRFVEQEYARAGIEAARQQRLLLVAAAEQGDRHVGTRRADAGVGASGRAPRRLGAGRMNPPATDPLERRDGDVPADAEPREDAARLPLLGQQHHAGVSRGGRAGRADGPPAEGDGAAHDAGRPHRPAPAGDRCGRRRSVPASPTISPARTAKRDVAQAISVGARGSATSRVFDAQQLRAPSPARRGSVPRTMSRPTIRRTITSSVSPWIDSVATRRPSRRTVTRDGEAPHFVELVRDVEHRHATRGKRADQRLQAHRFGRAERRGRFVHDQAAGVERERVGHGDQLPLRRSAAVQQLARIDCARRRSPRAGAGPWW